MKINPIFLTFLFWDQICTDTLSGQKPSDVNPDFRIEAVKLPYRANYHHVNILGQHPDGSLLVQCSQEKDPEGVRFGRQLFWVKKDAAPVEETGQTFGQTDVQYLRAIARYDEQTLFYTTEISGNHHLYRAVLDKRGRLISRQKVLIASWNKAVLHPFFFHPRTSNYPVLLFSARPEGRHDLDIFYSELRDGAWTAPAPLPTPGINSPDTDESCPVVDSEGTLFFVSNRAENPGSRPSAANTNLVFFHSASRPFWQGGTQGELPPPFNSTLEERTIAPAAPGLRAGYLVSGRQKGRLTLFRFESVATDPSPPPPRYYALIAAVDDYDHIGDLRCPIAECRELATVLRDYEFDVDTLENPSAARFLDRLAQYHVLEENEYLLVAFLGHGYRALRPGQAPPYDTCSVLVGRDGQCLRRAVDGVTCEAFEHCIAPEDLDRTLKLISRPRHILVVLDVCFSGLFKPLPTRNDFDKKSRQVIASSISNEVEDCGDFFPLLVEKIRSGSQVKGGFLTAEEIFNYIYPRIAQGKKNLPTIFPMPGYERGGDFPFPVKRRN